MAKNPAVWDALPWSCWDPDEIYSRVDIKGRTVLDIGAGTGQVSIRCVPYASFVFALEPVGCLRRYMERKIASAGYRNFQTVNGLLKRIPLANNAIDVGILSSGAIGWNLDEELNEIDRVVKDGGSMLMLAACRDTDTETINKIERRGYEKFKFCLPTEEQSPSFLKRF